MAYAEVNGQRLYYEDSGGDGPPVILGHGFLMDHEMFAPQVAALAPEFRVITWDERGFGLTEFDDKPFTYWDSADDCLGLLTHLGIERAVVGGMSQGGFLSMRAALDGARTGEGARPARHAVRQGERGRARRLSAAAGDVALGRPGRRTHGHRREHHHRRP